MVFLTSEFNYNLQIYHEDSLKICQFLLLSQKLPAKTKLMGNFAL